MYKTFDNNDYEYLRSIFPPERMEYEKISEDYFHDELAFAQGKPNIVLFPLDTEEISLVMKYAYEKNIPVVVRGSGTGLVGGCVATRGGILLVTTLMNKILSLDNENLSLTVQVGTLLMDINKFLADTPFFYPPDPGEKSATIGGNISTNAGGMRAVKYGVTRDYVRSLTCVTCSGKVVEFGSNTVKNSSGYDLKDLIIGSEGTLAVITQATLKLIPKPKFSISLLLPYSDRNLAIASVPKIIAQPITPTAVEFFEKEAIEFAEKFMNKKFPDNGYPSYILLSFDGNDRQSVIADSDQISATCVDELGAIDALLIDTTERSETVWGARGVFLEAIKASTTEMDECDVVVPRNKVADFLNFTYQVGKTCKIRIASFGHAGDGNLHIYLCKDELGDAEFEMKLNQAFSLLYGKAEEMGGLVSGEHGIGIAKKGYLNQTLGEKAILMKGIKAVFDPKNILNPDKVIE